MIKPCLKRIFEGQDLEFLEDNQWFKESTGWFTGIWQRW